MTETKFTPGPWAVRFDETITVRAPDHSRICQLTMLSASGRRDGSENEANAHLIAAAPDEDKALEECLVLLKVLTGPDDELAQAVIQMAEKARAKARGENS